ncbi:hypothetical protein B0A49_08702 [Cryomyces minteri]|uniref:Uncharacterized protein n=1 Tax=Cryomyces minteri TaxID=331657 RepID=A0A4U0WQD4_9PEZI|nr:hypothetical protein B0A49_13137 [Cryomyces minteri]TKA64052.1 hypothetical protein B0A49_09643 [Cryomyces minteri]TKA65107.1 hypothetical protein B0A49_08702 [Cryomyces minteri]
MASLRSFRSVLPLLRQPARPFSTTTAHLSSPPMDNQPPSRKGGSQAPNADKQSSASTAEDKSGDDHPAKQPDQQTQPTRSTGIGGETQVKGGKEGMGNRSDKEGEAGKSI